MSSFSSQNVLLKHKQRSNQQEITIFRTSNESHTNWKKHLEKSVKCFRIYAGSEIVNEFDDFSIGDNSAIVFKQNPICNGQ